MTSNLPHLVGMRADATRHSAPVCAAVIAFALVRNRPMIRPPPASGSAMVLGLASTSARLAAATSEASLWSLSAASCHAFACAEPRPGTWPVAARFACPRCQMRFDLLFKAVLSFAGLYSGFARLRLDARLNLVPPLLDVGEHLIGFWLRLGLHLTRFGFE